MPRVPVRLLRHLTVVTLLLGLFACGGGGSDGGGGSPGPTPTPTPTTFTLQGQVSEGPPLAIRRSQAPRLSSSTARYAE